MFENLKLLTNNFIKKESGFTLIEAIISVAIVAIIVVPFSLIFNKGLITSVETKNQLRANQLAQEYVEAYNQKTYLDITTELAKSGSKYSKTIVDGDYSVEIDFEKLGNDYEIDDKFKNTKVTNFDGLVYFYNEKKSVYLYSNLNAVELKQGEPPESIKKELGSNSKYNLTIKENVDNILYDFDGKEIAVAKTSANYRIVMYLDNLIEEDILFIINNNLENEKLEIVNYISARNKAKFNYDVQKGKVFISNEKSTELEYNNRLYQLNVKVSKDGVELENIATTVKAK